MPTLSSTPRSSNRTCGFAASGSRRRLTQSPRPLHVTLSATSENNVGVVRLIANLPFCRRFLRPPSTEAPSLCRSYPASSVIRASPPSQSARPVSHELLVDPHCDHRWDFPCCVWSTLLTCRRQYPGRSGQAIVAGYAGSGGGSEITAVGACCGFCCPWIVLATHSTEQSRSASQPIGFMDRYDKQLRLSSQPDF